MSEGRERCPECGRPITPEERRARWIAAISAGQKRAWRDPEKRARRQWHLRRLGRSLGVCRYAAAKGNQ